MKNLVFLSMLASSLMVTSNLMSLDASLEGSSSLYTQHDFQKSLTNLKSISRDFHHLFPGPYSRENPDSLDSHQKTLELFAGSEKLNKNEKISAFAVKNNAYIAVLFKDKKDFIVMTSNFKKLNDMGVEGTKFPKDNPAYHNLSESLGFEGKIKLWGKEYFVKVDPVKDKKGELIAGFLFAFPIAIEN